MKKRILSMLLALVMVLSMVPVQALAEEAPVPEESLAEIVTEEPEAEDSEITEATETTGETEATETTETTEETEVTETTETTEETEVTETTEVTEETEVTEATEETVAMEAETVVEPQGELEADGDAEGPETVFIVPYDPEEEGGAIQVGQIIRLTVEHQDGITVQNLAWDGGKDEAGVKTIATVDSSGYVTGVEVGETIISVTCYVKYDGDPELYPAEGFYSLTVEEPETPVYTIRPTQDAYEMRGGEAITLTADVLDEEDEPVVSQVPLLKWELVDKRDEEYVTLKPNGVLSALPTLQYKREIAVRVSFADEELNPENVGDLPTVTVTVYPRVKTIEMLVDDSNENIKDGEYLFNLNDFGLCTLGINISTRVSPDDTNAPIDLKVSDSRNLCYRPEGGDGSVCIRPVDVNKTGSVTVTATAMDGSGVSAKLVIRFVKLATEVKILDAPAQMRGISSVTLTTNVATEKGLTDRKILWSVVGEDGNPTTYATINGSGKLTANRVDEPVKVMVKATTAMGGIESEYAVIEIVPAVDTIEILFNRNNVDTGNIPYNASPEDDPIVLTAKVMPNEAIQEVTWSTSNKNVVSLNVNDEGRAELVIKNAGKVRITATTTDGSKKTASVYLTITKPVNEVRFDASNPTELRSGQSHTMKVTAWTDYDENDTSACIKAANQKVKWKVFELVDGIPEETTKAVISASGRLSVKDVNRNIEIRVRATSTEKAPVVDGFDDRKLNEDGYAFEEYDLTIKPAKRITFLLKRDGEYLTTSTISMNPKDSTYIEGFLYNSDVLEDEDPETPADVDRMTFNSSNKSVATIEDGEINTLKTGTTTITVSYRETSGTYHSVKFTLKVTNLVEELQITRPSSTELRSGKSLTLKATTWTDYYEGVKASNQKVKWEIEFAGDVPAYLAKYENPMKEVATISGGRVVAKNVPEDVDVRVIATSVENPAAVDSIVLRIRPKQSYSMTVGFDYEGDTYTGTVYVPYNLSGVYTNLFDNLKVSVYDTSEWTAREGVEDNDELTWTTSNKSIVSIDAEANVMKVLKPGTVTLTAKKKVDKTTYSASIKLILVNAVEWIQVEQRVASQKLYAGKTLALRAITNDNATNKRVKWSLAEDDYQYATINASSGLITAKRTVTDMQQTIHVYVEAVDGYDGQLVDENDMPIASYEVTIYPLATEITPMVDGEALGGNTFDAEAGKDYVLDIATCSNGAHPEVKWTSSNSAVAAIKWDAEAKEYKLYAKKRGKAVIKAVAQDGSGKSASFTVEVTNPS